jgi:signal transduction histidine kinase
LSGDAFLSVINDVLDFSKIEAGKTYLEAQDFNLRDSLQDMVRGSEGFERVYENPKGYRKPLAFAKAYLSGF